MELWIGVALGGGIVFLIGLLVAVRRLGRREIRPLEFALLLAACVPVAVAVVLLLTGPDRSDYAGIAIWSVVAVALWVESRRRRREIAGQRERRS